MFSLLVNTRFAFVLAEKKFSFLVSINLGDLTRVLATLAIRRYRRIGSWRKATPELICGQEAAAQGSNASPPVEQTAANQAQDTVAALPRRC
jgi:hypothetical protein